MNNKTIIPLVITGIFTAGAIIFSLIMVFTSGGPTNLLVNQEDFTISITINEEVDYSFAISQIENITLIQTLPDGRRTNGISNTKISRGYYSFDDYGDAKVYVYKNSTPYILFELPDYTIIYGDEDSPVTNALYNQINALLD